MADIKQEMTYDQYVDALVVAAKRIQGENYVGDEWYLDVCSWENYYENGTSPEDAVVDDMSYWDS